MVGTVLGPRLMPEVQPLVEDSQLTGHSVRSRLLCFARLVPLTIVATVGRPCCDGLPGCLVKECSIDVSACSWQEGLVEHLVKLL